MNVGEFALESAVAAFNLVVFGAHALLPFRLAKAEERWRRLWAVLAPLLLLSACIATAWAIGRRPDDAIAWGLTHPFRGSMAARLIAVALAAAALSDLFVLATWRRLDAVAWRFHGAIGALALAAQAMGAELLRIGDGPWSGTAAILAAAGVRAALALASAETVTGGPRLWSTIAGPSLLALLLLWPAVMRAALSRDLLTLGAAALLLVGARFAPASLRRPAAVAGVVLALLFLARATEQSRTLGGRQQLHEYELEP